MVGTAESFDDSTLHVVVIVVMVWCGVVLARGKQLTCGRT